METEAWHYTKKKWSFPLRISLGKVTKSAGNWLRRGGRVQDEEKYSILISHYFTMKWITLTVNQKILENSETYLKPGQTFMMVSFCEKTSVTYVERDLNKPLEIWA